jgi:hypothetical protein
MGSSMGRNVFDGSMITQRKLGCGQSAPSAESVQHELEQLKQRHSDLRVLHRKPRTDGTEVRKLEPKLEKPFAAAKWTAGRPDPGDSAGLG